MSFSRLTASRQLTHDKSTPPVQQRGVKRKPRDDTQAAAGEDRDSAAAVVTRSHRDKRTKFHALPTASTPPNPRTAAGRAKLVANRARAAKAKVTRAANLLREAAAAKAAADSRAATEAKSVHVNDTRIRHDATILRADELIDCSFADVVSPRCRLAVSPLPAHWSSIIDPAHGNDSLVWLDSSKPAHAAEMQEVRHHFALSMRHAKIVSIYRIQHPTAYRQFEQRKAEIIRAGGAEMIAYHGTRGVDPSLIYSANSPGFDPSTGEAVSGFDQTATDRAQIDSTD
jgi:hypothetical protein